MANAKTQWAVHEPKLKQRYPSRTVLAAELVERILAHRRERREEEAPTASLGALAWV